MQLTPEELNGETCAHEVAELLRAWSEGDRASLENIMPLVHLELHRLARRYMGGEQAGHTLQTTALVHEAYLWLVGTSPKNWQNRSHFFAVSAQSDASQSGRFRTCTSEPQARRRRKANFTGRNS